MLRIPLALLADSANVSQDGKLNILGIFENIMSFQFPVSHPTMALVFAVEGDTGDIEREHDLTVDLIDSDGVRMANVGGKLKFPQLPAGHVRGNQIIYFNGLQFPKPGVYEFKVIINGEVRASVPIGLNKIEPPQK